MGVGGSLRRLGEFIGECEERRLVRNVELAEDIDPTTSRALTAAIELTFTTRSTAEEGRTLSLDAASVDEDGQLQLTLESMAGIVPTDNGIDLEPAEMAIEDGEITVTLAASVPTDDGPCAAGKPATRQEAGEENAEAADTDRDPDPKPDGGGSGSARRDREVPPFKDPELLEEVYESCDRFAEMADALGMDVTGETVRRYMIEHGIHTPNSYDTSGDDTDDKTAEMDDELESPTVVADGIGLPEDVTAETLVETVREANTIYEVKRDLGIDRDAAADMLRELDLLDVVVGRLATEAEREISREEVIDRLRQSAAAR